jgi:hypothetical protein
MARAFEDPRARAVLLLRFPEALQAMSPDRMDEDELVNSGDSAGVAVDTEEGAEEAEPL